jgi:hypothetical protein
MRRCTLDELALGRKVLQHFVCAPVVELACLVRVPLRVATGDRRTGALDVAIVEEHDDGAGRNRACHAGEKRIEPR